jgi:glycine cleavage system H lipoate-binding protein
MGKGWLFKMKIAERSQIDALTHEQAYRSHVEALRPQRQLD